MARVSHRLASAAMRGPKRKERVRSEGGGVEAGHHVAGAAPAVDGLGGVADHDELGVRALGGEDLLQDRVGVLCFVEEEEVGFDSWPGQSPHLQVVVVFEADCAAVGVLQVGPGL